MLFYLLAGFVGGLLIAQLIRFLQGKVVLCAACGQRQWVPAKMSNPCCCRCRSSLDETTVQTSAAGPQPQ